MLLARTGRHRQRYEEKFRLVAGCIPYRLKENDEDVAGNLENRLEVLMVSSPNRHDLVFPKGGWEDDESVLQAACREAWEEAGVQGILDVTVSEAFELCRYEWMRKALRVFLRVLSDDGQPQQDREEVPSAGPVAEVAEPSSILQQACFMKPSDQGLNLVVLG